MRRTSWDKGPTQRFGSAHDLWHSYPSRFLHPVTFVTPRPVHARAPRCCQPSRPIRTERNGIVPRIVNGYRLLSFGLLLALLIIALPAAAASNRPRAESAGLNQNAQTGELSGSVVVRDSNEVSAASVDFEAYAADRYIVRFSSTVRDAVATTDRLARSLGFSPTHIYTERVRGFAARLSADQVDRLDARSEIAAIETDDIIPAPSTYGMPTGVERIGTLTNPTAKINGSDQRVNVDVAVVDSGVQRDHPDLNVTRWFDCTEANGNGEDDLGHGTHVAGTIGALDNGTGVVGVAPGARIWGFRVMVNDPNTGRASGLWSWIICGIDTARLWTTDHGDGLGDIEVANMSLGGGG